MTLTSSKAKENVGALRTEELSVLSQNAGGNGNSPVAITDQASGNHPAKSIKNPPVLIAEYRLLTRKKRLKQMSVEEYARLQVVMNTIAEIDRTDPSAKVWQEKYKELAAELQQIRTEAEAILAARKP